MRVYMDATPVVAIYGASVATASAAVQFVWWRTTRTNIRVEAAPGTAPVHAGSDGGGGVLTRTGEVVFIRITNRSAHPVKVRSLSAIHREGSNLAFPSPYPPSLPIEIPPRDYYTVWVHRDQIDENERLRFAITTTDDRTFKSRRVVLADEDKWHIGST